MTEYKRWIPGQIKNDMLTFCVSREELKKREGGSKINQTTVVRSAPFAMSRDANIGPTVVDDAQSHREPHQREVG